MKTIRDVMNINISDIDFSVRCTNCMRNMGIATLADLTRKKVEDLRKMKNMGTKSIEEIKTALMNFDLTFEMTDEAWLQWGMMHVELIKRL